MMGMGIVGFGSLELVGLAFFFVGMPGVGSGILARFYYVQCSGSCSVLEFMFMVSIVWYRITPPVP